MTTSEEFDVVLSYYANASGHTHPLFFASRPVQAASYGEANAIRGRMLANIGELAPVDAVDVQVSIEPRPRRPGQ